MYRLGELPLNYFESRGVLDMNDADTIYVVLTYITLAGLVLELALFNYFEL